MKQKKEVRGSAVRNAPRRDIVRRLAIFALFSVMVLPACSQPTPESVKETVILTESPLPTHAMYLTYTPQEPLPTFTPQKGLPKVVNHPEPRLVSSTRGLSDAGCSVDVSLPRVLNCPSDVLEALGCDYLALDNLLGGLTPDYPVMRCVSRSGEVPNQERFRRVGCYFGHFESYVLLKDGDFRLIDQKSEFQAVFAPIESANEALSYALSVTDLDARYGITPGIGDYLVDTIEDTHVDETEDRYLVHLHSGFVPPCGCGVHTDWAVDVLVTREGEVWSAQRTALREFRGCLD